MKPMRATWITSAVAGLPFGFVAALAGLGGEKPKGAIYIAAWAVGVLFVPSLVVCVIGISQLREMSARRRLRSSWLSHQVADGPDFLVPLWGRMGVCSIAAVAGSLISKVFE